MVCINDEDEADEEDEAVVSYGYLLVAFAFLQLSHFCDDYKNDIITYTQTKNERRTYTRKEYIRKHERI